MLLPFLFFVEAEIWFLIVRTHGGCETNFWMPLTRTCILWTVSLCHTSPHGITVKTDFWDSEANHSSHLHIVCAARNWVAVCILSSYYLVPGLATNIGIPLNVQEHYSIFCILHRMSVVNLSNPIYICGHSHGLLSDPRPQCERSLYQ
jgi:hypothetical protein